MVQKQSMRSRGRPRQYDPQQALSQAMDAFWRSGYAATSLDDLSAATQMNRPSLYNAFGDKRRIYLSLLDRYIASSHDTIREELASERPLKEALTRLYRRVLSMYGSSGSEARGCFLMGTAVTEAGADEEVRAKLAAALTGFAHALEKRLHRAQEQGELAPHADTAGLAGIASAVLHSLGVRARAGHSHASLLATADSAVQMICGSEPVERKRARKAKP